MCSTARPTSTASNARTRLPLMVAAFGAEIRPSACSRISHWAVRILFRFAPLTREMAAASSGRESLWVERGGRQPPRFQAWPISVRCGLGESASCFGLTPTEEIIKCLPICPKRIVERFDRYEQLHPQGLLSSVWAHCGGGQKFYPHAAESF